MARWYWFGEGSKVNLYNHFFTKMHIMQTFIDFYMHDRAEFRGFEVDFALREADFWENSVEKMVQNGEFGLKKAALCI